MKNMKTDYELINSFINGDERSIEVLILRHKSKVYSYNDLFNKKNSKLKYPDYSDTELWDFDFENNWYLSNIKHFLDRNLMSS